MGWGKLPAVCHALCLVRWFTRGRISAEGTAAADWDKNTWPELKRLAESHPEAGIHFQGYG